MNTPPTPSLSTPPPLLSIITVNRNNAKGLQKTVESVITQNCNNFEYIVIDGASTDGSAKLLQDYGQNPAFAKRAGYWISEPDTGIYNAMNKGIKKAHGKYLYMLNSGDWLEDNALSCVIHTLQNEKPDLLLFFLNIWDFEEKIQSAMHFPEKLRLTPMCHQAFVYKKSMHKQYGLYNERYKFVADYDFCIKAFYNKDIRTATLSLPVANFFVGGCGDSELSLQEFNALQIKYGFSEYPKKNALYFIKKTIKYILPYACSAFYKKLKKELTGLKRNISDFDN